MKKTHPRGFTIYELLIIVGIIGILSSIVVMRFSGTTNPIDLSNGQAVLTSDLSKIINWSQTGKIEPTTNTVPLGYGLVFFPGEKYYYLYADYDADNLYSKNSSDVLLETVDLEKGELVRNVLIQTCTPLSATGTCDFLVTYENAKMYTNGQRDDNLEIILHHEKDNANATVLVNIISG